MSLEEFFEKAARAFGRRVAAVQKGMHEHRHAGVATESSPAPPCDPDANARRRATAGPSDARAPLAAFDLGDQRPAAPAARASVPSSIATSMRGRSCATTRPAPIFMWPDFGIAHLARGQAHRAARGRQQRMRTFGQQAGVIGGAAPAAMALSARDRAASPSHRGCKAEQDAGRGTWQIPEKIRPEHRKLARATARSKCVVRA